ncbi:MAG: hydrogenase expression/formation protein HypE [Candidatus Cloacimonadota bacterium]|nr:MAG: hydrogenase expression/formation protein HypE [Candidatus Cloacimonadota bacterium]
MDTIMLEHGSGGRMMHSLIRDVFVKGFDSPHLRKYEDSAVLEIMDKKIVFTTDSYVVDPIFFPGGDIGMLSVAGTVNDIAVMGAIPNFISCGLILEEGFSREDLQKIVDSMKQAADKSSCTIVTGDTKVVDRGKVDKIFINTSAIGTMIDGVSLSKESIKPGDKILINGFIGDHGIAVLSKREGMEFGTSIKSDVQPLNMLIKELLSNGLTIRFMRDPTRGGIATTLNEICDGMGFGIELFEEMIPVRDEVRGYCELLGLDPLYVANEGKVIAVVGREDSDKALEIMKRHPDGEAAAFIGEITEENAGTVSLRTTIGSHRIVDMLSGAQLPRIC